MLACGSDSLKPSIIDSKKLYWELELNHRAVTLGTPGSGYDTLILVATPRNTDGDPLTGLPAPQFTSSDVERVRVMSNGKLEAVAQTSSHVWVYATLTAGNVKHSDSVQVRVVNTATPTVLTSFSVDPVPPDSAKQAAGIVTSSVQPVLPVRALDANGDPITGLPVYFRSSDPLIATVHRATGAIIGYRTGTATLYATTTAFGVTKSDTLQYQIGLPLNGRLSLTRVPGNGAGTHVFIPSEVQVVTNGIVEFETSDLSDPSTIAITFAEDDLPHVVAINTLNLPEGVGNKFQPTILYLCVGAIPFVWPIDCSLGGNVEITGAFGSQAIPFLRHRAARVFNAPGIYEVRSIPYGATARIIVRDDD
jgi:hypothetical protein